MNNGNGGERCNLCYSLMHGDDDCPTKRLKKLQKKRNERGAAAKSRKQYDDEEDDSSIESDSSGFEIGFVAQGRDMMNGGDKSMSSNSDNMPELMHREEEKDNASESSNGKFIPFNRTRNATTSSTQEEQK